MWIFLPYFHFWISAEKNHFQMVLMNCVKIFFWHFKKLLFRWWSDQLEKWQAFLNYSLSVTTVCQNNGADDDVWWWRSWWCWRWTWWQWCWWRNPIWRLVAVITFGPPATITVHPLHWCKTPSLMMKSENQTEMIKARKIQDLANKS